MFENWRWTTGRVWPEQSNGWTLTAPCPFAAPAPPPFWENIGSGVRECDPGVWYAMLVEGCSGARLEM